MWQEKGKRASEGFGGQNDREKLKLRLRQRRVQKCEARSVTGHAMVDGRDGNQGCM